MTKIKSLKVLVPDQWSETWKGVSSMCAKCGCSAKKAAPKKAVAKKVAKKKK